MNYIDEDSFQNPISSTSVLSAIFSDPEGRNSMWINKYENINKTENSSDFL